MQVSNLSKIFKHFLGTYIFIKLSSQINFKYSLKWIIGKRWKVNIKLHLATESTRYNMKTISFLVKLLVDLFISNNLNVSWDGRLVLLMTTKLTSLKQLHVNPRYISRLFSHVVEYCCNGTIHYKNLKHTICWLELKINFCRIFHSQSFAATNTTFR